MPKRKSKVEPKFEGMVEVTPGNRKSLENKYGYDIGIDVAYILPTQALEALLDDPESWEEKR
jgi:hypothetical protein